MASDTDTDTVTLTLGHAEAAAALQAIADQETATAQTTASVSTWEALPNAPIASSRTDDIWFADDNTGWLVNSNGQVCHTTDGGNSWPRQFFVDPTHPARPYLRTIHFAPNNPQVGWFGALCGTRTNYLEVLLHQTKDGGKTWTPVTNLPQNSPQGICGISVVDDRVMYGSGNNDPARPKPGIIKTVDGGQSWTLIDLSAQADNLIDIRFFTKDRGFVVGGKNSTFCPGNQPWYGNHRQYARLRPVVLYTEDGGATWTNLVAALTTAFDCGSWGWKLFWLDEQRGFVAIEDFRHGAILKTEDGGKNWVMLRINDRRRVSGKSGKQPKQTKGGKGKDPKTVMVANANLEGIGFLDENQGWVGGWGDEKFVGNYNSVTKNGGRNWTAQDHDPDNPASDPRVNVNRYRVLNEVAYCSGKTVYKLQLDGGKTRTKTKSVSKTTAKSAVAAQPRDLGLRIRPGDNSGEVSVGFDVPNGTKRLYLGVWDHFGWFRKTLVDETDAPSGPRTIIWDGNDEDGSSRRGEKMIFRLIADDEHASETYQLR